MPGQICGVSMVEVRRAQCRLASVPCPGFGVSVDDGQEDLADGERVHHANTIFLTGYAGTVGPSRPREEGRLAAGRPGGCPSENATCGITGRRLAPGGPGPTNCEADADWTTASGEGEPRVPPTNITVHNNLVVTTANATQHFSSAGLG